MDRRVERIVQARALMEGAGVKVLRTIALRELDHLDPFLLLDHFDSTDPDDWRAGFPEHPHRGIETVTYVLDGEVRHGDSLGNSGTIGPGDVQWMTAGRGIVHSEMPDGSGGRMRGFQLWVNLPAADKRRPPRYQEIAARDIPVLRRDGSTIRLISGSLDGARGAVDGIATDPLYLDLRLDPPSSISIPVPADHTCFAYAYDGEASIGGTAVSPRELAILTQGDLATISATGHGAGLLLVAGRPLHESMVRWGPFVMNTEDEIRQAIEDYRSGRLQTG